MSFKEWLPVTVRNRVALLLAFAALVMFVVWNCLPDYGGGPETRIVATSGLWSDVFSPDLYLEVIRSRDVEGFMYIASLLALVFNGVAALLVIPFWQTLHASNYLRIPIALGNLSGGSAIVCILASGFASASWHVALYVMAFSMFFMSAALFLFQNELALREERNRPLAQ